MSGTTGWRLRAFVCTLATTKSDSLIAFVTPGLPPLQAKIGLLSEPSSSTSCVRPLRMGPTGSGALVWKTAANRVRCSTFSSNTMSA